MFEVENVVLVVLGVFDCVVTPWSRWGGQWHQGEDGEGDGGRRHHGEKSTRLWWQKEVGMVGGG